MAYLDEFELEVNGKKITNRTLWTHAGVTNGWFKELMREINHPSFKFNEFFIGSGTWKIDKVLNLVWDLRIPNIFNVDNASGGIDLWAGPLWVRPHILNDFHLEGYDQKVGHTPQSSIYEVCPLFGVESNPEKLNTITYVDALEHGYFDMLKRLKDEIKEN
jgi:hypothetical protein